MLTVAERDRIAYWSQLQSKVTSVVRSQSHAAPTERQNRDKSQSTSIYFNSSLSKFVWEGTREGNTLQAHSRGCDAKEETDRKHLSSDPHLSLISFSYHVCRRLSPHTHTHTHTHIQFSDIYMQVLFDFETKEFMIMIYSSSILSPRVAWSELLPS